MPGPNFLLLALSAFAQAQAGVVPPAQPNAPPATSSATPVESTDSESFRAATRDLRKAARAARLKNRGEIASHQDYPKEALDQSMQGTTVTRMLVNLDGRVAGMLDQQEFGPSSARCADLRHRDRQRAVRTRPRREGASRSGACPAGNELAAGINA